MDPAFINIRNKNGLADTKAEMNSNPLHQRGLTPSFRTLPSTAPFWTVAAATACLLHTLCVRDLVRPHGGLTTPMTKGHQGLGMLEKSPNCRWRLEFSSRVPYKMLTKHAFRQFLRIQCNLAQKSFKFVIFIFTSWQILPMSPFENFATKYRYKTKGKKKFS